MVSSTTALLLLAALLFLGSRPRTVADPPQREFVAQLTGAQEVPPVTTAGTGEAVFRLDEAETETSFELAVQNLRNVTEAHVHLGAPGVNGPVVAFLFGPTRGTTRSGLLASGTITAASLRGPLAGRPLSALVAEMRAGSTYANVHTLAHPDGEIRGQIVPRV